MASTIGLLLSDDLLFTSKVGATARAQGLMVQTTRTLGGIISAAEVQSPGCVMIDVNLPGLDIEQLATKLKSMPTPPYLVAYGSHVMVDVLKQARAAGCDLVLPRSQFVAGLENELPKWIRGTQPG